MHWCCGEHEEFPPPTVKTGIRKMLKRGGFSPSGRNKPASEYLAQTAREGRFPAINNLVDINNLVSLEHGLPISMLDLDVAGEAIEIRYGRAGEKYVFNSMGQEIDLEGLICICLRDGGRGIAAGESGEGFDDGEIEGEHARDHRGGIWQPRGG